MGAPPIAILLDEMKFLAVFALVGVAAASPLLYGLPLAGSSYKYSSSLAALPAYSGLSTYSASLAPITTSYSTPLTTSYSALNLAPASYSALNLAPASYSIKALASPITYSAVKPVTYSLPAAPIVTSYAKQVVAPAVQPIVYQAPAVYQAPTVYHAPAVVVKTVEVDSAEDSSDEDVPSVYSSYASIDGDDSDESDD